MVNVYFCVINEVTKPILNELRHVRSKNVKLWFDDDAILSDPYIRSIKDKGYINHKNIDNELSCFSWDIVEKKVTGCYDGKSILYLVVCWTIPALYVLMMLLIQMISLFFSRCKT